MENNKIYNEGCLETISRMIKDNIKINVVLTSPPYNTSYKHGSDKYMTRYGKYSDTLSNEEYIEKTVKLFEELDKVLEKNGVIIYNLSYSTRQPSLYLRVMSAIIEKTKFEVVDKIIWKKNHAIPDNRSSNRLTRIIEDIFILARKNEVKTFQCNKDILNVAKSGAVNYQPIHNYIEAKNNDGVNPYNKATYSTDLCYKLLNIYAKKDDVIFDPFIGVGTTAFACIKYGCNYIGSEIDEKQCEYSNKKIKALELELF